MVIPIVSCFSFYGLGMESLSAINLYVQLITLMSFLYGHPMVILRPLCLDTGLKFDAVSLKQQKNTSAIEFFLK